MKEARLARSSTLPGVLFAYPAGIHVVNEGECELGEKTALKCQKCMLD